MTKNSSADRMGWRDQRWLERKRLLESKGIKPDADDICEYVKGGIHYVESVEGCWAGNVGLFSSVPKRIEE